MRGTYYTEVTKCRERIEETGWGNNFEENRIVDHFIQWDCFQ